MTGNEHLINYKDYQESLCNRCYSLGFPMRQESFMLCQKCGCVYSIKFDFTSGTGAEINNRKSKQPYTSRSCCIEQSDTLGYIDE